MMEMMGYDLPFPCHSERSEESPPFAQRKGARGMPASKTSAYAFNNQHPSFTLQFTAPNPLLGVITVPHRSDGGFNRSCFRQFFGRLNTQFWEPPRLRQDS